MNLPIPAQPHALAPHAQSLPRRDQFSAGRPKFLPTHWPLPEVRVRQPALLTGPVDIPARRWPGVILKVLAVALCYALVRDVEAGDRLSLRYGEPQVLSALGDPVDIRIPITSTEVSADARFILGQQDATLGLPLIRHANIRLERDARGWALRIQSNRRSTDPAMALVVQEVVGGGVISRALPVLFDPAPSQAPIIHRAADDTADSAPLTVAASAESWWTSAVVNKPAPRPDSAASLVGRHTDDTSAARLASAAEPATPHRAQTRAPLSPPGQAEALRAQAVTRTAPARVPLIALRAPGPATGSTGWATPSAPSGLRLTTALNIPTTSPVSPTAADRESLRWLQRSMLGEDRTAMLVLSRKVVQLSAQVEQLESRLAEASVASRQFAGRPAATTAASPAGGAAQPPATPNASTGNLQPLKISALMSDPASRNESNPWGLPLLAGLMLGAGYWSGRRSRSDSQAT